MNCFFKYRYVIIFKPLVKKLRWNLNRKYIAFNANGIYRLEPCIEVFFFYIYPNYFETIIPYCATAYVHFSAEFLKFLIPFRDRGDKDVKKEVMKTSDPAIDFLEKRITIIIS